MKEKGEKAKDSGRLLKVKSKKKEKDKKEKKTKKKKGSETKERSSSHSVHRELPSPDTPSSSSSSPVPLSSSTPSNTPAKASDLARKVSAPASSPTKHSQEDEDHRNNDMPSSPSSHSKEDKAEKKQKERPQQTKQKERPKVKQPQPQPQPQQQQPAPKKNNKQTASEDVTLLRTVDLLKAMELQEIEEDQIVKEGRVGEGPFAIVFRGTCRGQDVAIHLLKKQNLNKDEVASFKAQVKALSKMRNKHIVVLLGVVTTPGKLALVTEWMPNTMAALCFEHSPIGLSLYERLKMAKDAALGVYWLHCSKTPLYHSNLKLSNFLVAEDGSVKVSDFGLLDMRLSSSAKQSSPTTYWQEDPPVRMAPEYLTGSSAYDEKCDVYSFGLCLYEVLTGKEAFRKLKKRLLQQKKGASNNNNNDDKEAVTRRILEEVIEVVVEEEMRPVLPQDVPPRLADLIRCCWHPLPNCRPNFADILRVASLIFLEKD
ncbi:Dual specificity protein kinase [Balamuthia mandrillaris]